MNNKPGLLALGLLALGTGLYFGLEHGRQEVTESTTAAPASTPVTAPRSGTDSAPTKTSRLSHPTVLAYMAREDDKQRLRDYFAGQGEQEPEAIWALIESLEQQQRVLGFEALHLKLAWLEKQHDNREDFNAAAQQLLEEYRQRAAEAGDSYRPENVPGYTDYKARESEIIAQVNRMQSFPDGLSRAEYLRQQLLDARLQAYGETR